MHSYDVTTKKAPSLVLATIGRQVDQDEPGVLLTAFGELFATLGAAPARAGAARTGRRPRVAWHRAAAGAARPDPECCSPPSGSSSPRSARRSRGRAWRPP